MSKQTYLRSIIVTCMLTCILTIIITCLYLGYDVITFRDNDLSLNMDTSSSDQIISPTPTILLTDTTPTTLPDVIVGKPDHQQIQSFQNGPIPFKSRMGCKSYHEMKKISFKKLWNYPPVRVLIGIWSVPEGSEIRQFIRTLNQRQQRNLTDDKVDFKFILGKPNPYNSTLKSRLTAENNTYGDLVMLDISENMNNGKAYHYWKWTASKFSPPYDYVVKTDDDAFVHFQNLALNLRPLPRKNLYYGMNAHNAYVRGMIEVLSVDVSRMIASFPYVKTEWRGPEDIRLGAFLGTKKNIHPTGEDCLIFNDPRISSTYMPSMWKPWAAPQAIVIHWLKGIGAWKAVIDLYFPDQS